MLNVARSRLDDETRSHCLVRHGDAYDLAISLEPGTFDVATLHHVLHFLEDPGRALAEAAAVLKPQGRLVIVDFAEHDEQRLRADFAHRWSGFSDDTIRQWCLAAGLSSPTVKTLPPPAGTGRLTTKVWTSVRAPDLTAEDRIASDEPMLEVAS